MPVRWSVLALSLCWLLPLAHETGRKVRLPGNDFDWPRLPSLLEFLLGHDGGASLGNGKGALTVTAGATDSQNERSRVTTDYCGLFRHRYRLRFRCGIKSGSHPLRTFTSGELAAAMAWR